MKDLKPMTLDEERKRRKVIDKRLFRVGLAVGIAVGIVGPFFQDLGAWFVYMISFTSAAIISGTGFYGMGYFARMEHELRLRRAGEELPIEELEKAVE
jgi:hypothetical protein